MTVALSILRGNSFILLGHLSRGTDMQRFKRADQ